MPVTACAYNYNPIFASYLNGCAFGCTSVKDGDADYHTTYSYDFAARHQNPAYPHFTTPDQMAETYTPFSLYAYCCGDPINFVDPTGMFSFENISKFSNYKVVVLIPQNYTKSDEINSSQGIGKTYSMAQKTGLPIIMYDNIADLANAFKELEAMDSWADIFVITSHGSSGSFSIGSDDVTRTTDLSALKDGLQGRQLFVNACNSAQGVAGSLLLSSISRQIECNSFGSCHTIKGGVKFDGAEGQFNTYGRNDFKVATPNGVVSHIKNFRLDINAGITYESINTRPAYMPLISNETKSVISNAKISCPVNVVIPNLGITR